MTALVKASNIGESSTRRPQSVRMNVHRYTSIYTLMIEDHTRLGKFIKVYAGNTTLTLPQIII